MSAYEPAGPEKFDAYEGPGQEPPKPGRGCFFWGCIISLIVFLLLIITIGTTGYLGYRWVINKALEYTDDQPMPMPALALDEEERQVVQQRWESFQESLEAGEADTLELTGEELNALLQTNEDIAGRIHVDIEDDRLRGRISMPLDELGIAPLSGRYFNAEGTFEASLVSGNLVVRMQEAQVKGEPVPEEFMAEIRKENLAKDVGRDPEQAELLRKFQSIEVRDGKMILRSREVAPATEAPESAPPAEPGEMPVESAPGNESEPASEGEPV